MCVCVSWLGGWVGGWLGARQSNLTHDRGGVRNTFCFWAPGTILAHLYSRCPRSEKLTTYPVKIPLAPSVAPSVGPSVGPSECAWLFLLRYARVMPHRELQLEEDDRGLLLRPSAERGTSLFKDQAVHGGLSFFPSRCPGGGRAGGGNSLARHE